MMILQEVIMSSCHLFRFLLLDQRLAQGLDELTRALRADYQRRASAARQRDQPFAVGSHKEHRAVWIELKWPLVAIHAGVERAPQPEARHIRQGGGSRDAGDLL